MSIPVQRLVDGYARAVATGGALVTFLYLVVDLRWLSQPVASLARAVTPLAARRAVPALRPYHPSSRSPLSHQPQSLLTASGEARPMTSTQSAMGATWSTRRVTERGNSKRSTQAAV